jgi:hypothetical protein
MRTASSLALSSDPELAVPIQIFESRAKNHVSAASGDSIVVLERILGSDRSGCTGATAALSFNNPLFKDQRADDHNCINAAILNRFGLAIADRTLTEN